jgi:hypothetical protein
MTDQDQPKAEQPQLEWNLGEGAPSVSTPEVWQRLVLLDEVSQVVARRPSLSAAPAPVRPGRSST